MRERRAVDDSPDDLADLTGLDIRSVTILWVEDQDGPTVEWSGCSSFEAEGMIAAAGRFLARLNYLPLLDDDDDDDSDEG